MCGMKNMNKTHSHTENEQSGTSLAVQWLRLRASTAGDMGSTPSGGINIPHAAQCGQKNTTQHNTTKQKERK